tara:strand:- start:1448 stop:2578 length:1131 start_codon:yes stop_codon:yes gene_type:complete
MKHLKIGGSTAARTVACPAWLGRADKLPKFNSSNNAADEGNLLHDVMEDYYSHDIEFETQLREGRKYNNQVLTEDLIENLAVPALTMVESVLDQYSVVDFICEPFVEIVSGEMGGSIDMLAISEDRKTIIVLDYKFGMKKVKAEENKQMLFYALASREDPKTKSWFDKVENLVCVIVQPKCSHTADIWETEASAIQRFSDTLFKALETPDKASSGGHCNYCPVAATCQTRKTEADSALIMDKKTAKEVAACLAKADELEVWIKDVRTLAQTYMDSGVIVPHYKLVDKRPTKKWTKEAGISLAGLIPHDLLYKETMITPAQALTMLKKEKSDMDISGYIVSVSSGLTLVHESDKREAVNKTVIDSLHKLVDAGGLNK